MPAYFVDHLNSVSYLSLSLSAYLQFRELKSKENLKYFLHQLTQSLSTSSCIRKVMAFPKRLRRKLDSNFYAEFSRIPYLCT